MLAASTPISIGAAGGATVDKPSEMMAFFYIRLSIYILSN
jgi:hypothetical protein